VLEVELAAPPELAGVLVLEVELAAPPELAELAGSTLPANGKIWPSRR